MRHAENKTSMTGKSTGQYIDQPCDSCGCLGSTTMGTIDQCCSLLSSLYRPPRTTHRQTWFVTRAVCSPLYMDHLYEQPSESHRLNDRRQRGQRWAVVVRRPKEGTSRTKTLPYSASTDTLSLVYRKLYRKLDSEG